MVYYLRKIELDEIEGETPFFVFYLASVTIYEFLKICLTPQRTKQNTFHNHRDPDFEEFIPGVGDFHDKLLEAIQGEVRTHKEGEGGGDTDTKNAAPGAAIENDKSIPATDQAQVTKEGGGAKPQPTSHL